MKKQVLKIMMLLALGVGLGTSAWGQAGVPDAGDQQEGSPLNPKVYLTGATGTIQIDKGYTNSTVDWDLYVGSDATGSAATETADPVNMSADLDNSDDSGSGGTDRTDWDHHQDDDVTTSATSTFYFKWDDDAAGSYYLQVTETADATHGGCVTVRGFHIFVMGFDIEVYASDDAGTRLTTDAELMECGDGDSYPAFMNDVLTIDGTNARTDILNSTLNPLPANETSLSGVHGVNPTTTRYYTAEIYYDTPGTNQGAFTPTDVASVTMDIEIAGTNVAAVDVNTINGTALLETENAVTTTTVNALTGSTTKFVFAVIFFDRWGTDLYPTAEVHNTTLYSEENAGGTNLGEEPNSYEDVDLSDETTESPSYYNNLSNYFTIYGKPATGPITAN